MLARRAASSTSAGFGTRPVMGRASCGLVPQVTVGAISSAESCTSRSNGAPGSLGMLPGLWQVLFSLGVLLFEVLTGRLPYPAGSVRQTFRRHACDPPADIRRSAPGLPPALAALVGRLLAHRPEDRPRAAAAVQQLVNLEIRSLRGRRSA